MVDGGLATEFEARGCDLNDDLWSAKLLLEDQDLIRQVHHDYLSAGADCIASISYQATVSGFAKRGLSEAEAIELLRTSVRLAIDTRDAFWREAGNRPGRLRPIVAASVGPYGAFLADGSEYTGRYAIDEKELTAFHRDRWHILADSGADVVACETIPSRREARILARLLKEMPASYAWFSFSCQDGVHLSDGNPVSEAVRDLAGMEQVAAVGINCIAPDLVPSLIDQVRAATDAPIVVYPNSGERWDAVNKRWVGTAAPVDFGAAAREWLEMGARLIGGCCRTGPQHVRRIRERLLR